MSDRLGNVLQVMASKGRMEAKCVRGREILLALSYGSDCDSSHACRGLVY